VREATRGRGIDSGELLKLNMQNLTRAPLFEKNEFFFSGSDIFRKYSDALTKEFDTRQSVVTSRPIIGALLPSDKIIGVNAPVPLFCP